jgi:hypothetical protein
VVTISKTMSVEARIRAAAIPGFPVASRRALRAAGVDHRAIARRIEDGRLNELWHGSLLIGIDPEDAPADLRHAAAIAAAGPDAALDGTTALHRRGLWDRHDGVIHVASITPHADIPGEPVRFHRRVVTSADRIDGLAVRPALDALVAAAVELTAHQLAYVIGRATYRREFTLEDVERRLADARSTRWISRLRRAVELCRDGSAGTRCNSEDLLLPHVTHAFGEPKVNVCGSAGIVDHEPDFCWPTKRWIVEIDGDQHVDDPVQRRKDEHRDAILRAAGWIVVRIYWRDVWRNPSAVIARLRAEFGA